ncbi:hypothetical protein Tco_1024915 [Tanacetum coccineum]
MFRSSHLLSARLLDDSNLSSRIRQAIGCTFAGSVWLTSLLAYSYGQLRPLLLVPFWRSTTDFEVDLKEADLV